MNYKGTYLSYKQTFIEPTDSFSAATELFEEKSIVTDKAAVYNIGHIIMQTLFECHVPRSIKHNFHSQQLQNGEPRYCYPKFNVASKGSVDVLGPLEVFTRTCLSDDASKRPSLFEMGIFISVCLNCIDLIYS
jgi:hypothetical protein